MKGPLAWLYDEAMCAKFWGIPETFFDLPPERANMLYGVYLAQNQLNAVNNYDQRIAAQSSRNRGK